MDEPSELAEFINQSAGADPNNRLIAKDRAEIVFQLAERAWNRYESRRHVEWRAAFGVWTALGAGAGIVLTARTWRPDLGDVLAGGGLSLLVFAGFLFFWLPYIKGAHYRDMHTSYYWETWLHVLLGDRPPAALRVEKEQKDWPTAYGKTDRFGERQLVPATETEAKGWRMELHNTQWMQLGVTMLFALLFFGALYSKYRQQSADERGGVRIEGQSLEIESAERFKLLGE